LNGILIIDKPAGWTSHDAVAKLRGALKQKRIGHGGTLDPIATGVLPVFIGRATRAAEFCENTEKEYIAQIKLGITTDTQDITGNVLSETDVNITADDLISVLPGFTGKQKQIPPMYSAKKKDGKKLYDLARKGIEIPREAADINIFELELLEDTGSEDKGTVPVSCELGQGDRPPVLRVVCSKGTYIRTLCHDIGEKLGCGGVMSALRRTRVGVYTIETAHSLDDVLAMCLTDSVKHIILPVDSIFSHYPGITIPDSEVKKAKNGASCDVSGNIQPGKYRVYAPNGEFLLLGEVVNNRIKTIKSFFEV